MTVSESYFVPACTAIAEIEVKRSRFIATIAHAPNMQEANSSIAAAMEQYPGARHHCWAYIAGPPGTNTRCSDAGEPSGSAGKPILNVLTHSGLGEIICIVSRYFGGIKLGVGGLVRAYSHAARSALDILDTMERLPLQQLKLSFPYSKESFIRKLLQEHTVTSEKWDYQGIITLTLTIDSRQVHPFKSMLSPTLNEVKCEVL